MFVPISFSKKHLLKHKTHSLHTTQKTQNKNEQIGGIKSKSLDEVLKNSAEDAVRMAVKGMLPKNKLGKKMLTKLKIYKGAEHPHQAQNPSIVDI